MTNEPSTDSRFDEILAARSAEVAALARRVQALVRDTLPDLDWVPNHGQEGIGFGVNQYGHDGWGVGVIGVAKNWVTLGFMRGAQLPDPHGIVEGTGRNVRHVKVRTAQAFEERRDALIALLRAATGVSAPAAVQGALDLGEVDEPVRHSSGTQSGRPGCSGSSTRCASLHCANLDGGARHQEARHQKARREEDGEAVARRASRRRHVHSKHARRAH